MDNVPKQSWLSLKSVTKFCLTYFSTLLVLTIIFTALNNEPMNEDQTKWWWAFLISLIASASMSITALIVLLYADYTRVGAGAEQDIEQSNDKVRSPAASTANSSSYKTVLTISSIPNAPDLTANKTAASPEQAVTFDDSLNQATTKSAKFINLTPSMRRPVTVVDMPAVNALKKSNNPALGPYKLGENLGSPPNSTNEKRDDRKRKKKFKNKHVKKKRSD